MLDPIRRYWHLYGGWEAFSRSRYMLPATLLGTLCVPLWIRPATSGWADIVIQVMPSLMGFSIAAMTVMLAFSDAKSLKAVTQGGKEKSYFVTTVANLMHFLVAQLASLIIAIVGKAYPHWTIAYFGMLVFFYALLVSIGAAGQLLNSARIINAAANLPDPPTTPTNEESDSPPQSGTVRRMQR